MDAILDPMLPRSPRIGSELMFVSGVNQLVVYSFCSFFMVISGY